MNTIMIIKTDCNRYITDNNTIKLDAPLSEIKIFRDFVVASKFLDKLNKKYNDMFFIKEI